jgi:hypothetical protein
MYSTGRPNAQNGTDHGRFRNTVSKLFFNSAKIGETRLRKKCTRKKAKGAGIRWEGNILPALT